MNAAALLWLVQAHPASVHASASGHFNVEYRDAGLVASAHLTMQGLPSPVHYLSSGPPNAQKLAIFLHGSAFSARTWQEVGVLDAVGLAGIRAVAPDLPGYAGGLR
jgi:pimeloyl-ACP methyl ester carboxylesterase